mgnify:CR=1 FL=1
MVTRKPKSTAPLQPQPNLGPAASTEAVSVSGAAEAAAPLLGAATLAHAPPGASPDPYGAPGDYGLPIDPKPHERDRWERQELYLVAFAKQGNHTRTCQSTGIHRETSIYWEEHNCFQFRERLKLAQERHRDWLESMHVFAPLDAASDRDKLLHPVLPIFALKGAWPEKYGDSIRVQDTSGVSLILKRLEQAGARSLAQRGIQPPAIDAEVRELPASEPEVT